MATDTKTEGDVAPPKPEEPSSMFRSADKVAAADPQLVCLSYANTPDKARLYANPTFLRVHSGVLRNLLEDISARTGNQQPSSSSCSTPTATTTSGSNSSSPAVEVRSAVAEAEDLFFTIPLAEDDCTAMEEALYIMYHSLPLYEMSWESAARLVVLADKYDIPSIMGKHNDQSEHVCYYYGWPLL